jgi:hypothetical protein
VNIWTECCGCQLFWNVIFDIYISSNLMISWSSWNLFVFRDCESTHGRVIRVSWDSRFHRWYWPYRVKFDRDICWFIFCSSHWSSPLLIALLLFLLIFPDSYLSSILISVLRFWVIFFDSHLSSLILIHLLSFSFIFPYSYSHS